MPSASGMLINGPHMQSALAPEILSHPLSDVLLTRLRAEHTSTEDFRRSLQQLSVYLFFEAARSWSTSPAEVQTPLRSAPGFVLSRHVVFIPILRAGLGMLDGILPFVPEARVGHIGLYRDELTLQPVSYYQRLPTNLASAEVLLLDPMLATGQSACEAISLIKKQGGVTIRFLCLVACPAGVAQLQRAHPDVAIHTAAIDPELNQFGYIVPGLGDAGDRYFGTG